MSSESKPAATVAGDSPQSPQALAELSGAYAALARGFHHPDEAVIEFFRDCGPTDAGDGEIARRVGELVAAARATTPDELRAAYMRLFDPVNGPFPYETEHRKGHDFSKAQVLADIRGFYRAFGVEPSGDRADHIAAEIEYMHLLTLKESHALAAGEPDKAAICRDARREFFREHLSAWADALLEMMRAAADRHSHPFYGHLTKLLQLLVDNERENLT